MTNAEMLQEYYNASASKVFYIGFTCNGKLYLYIARDTIPEKMLRKSRTSKTNVPQIRIQVTSTMAQLLVKDGKAIELDNENAIDYNDKYNRGDHFERYIIERFTDSVWSRNSTPWYIAGDAIIDGENVQIKFNYAELTNEQAIVKTRDKR